MTMTFPTDGSPTLQALFSNVMSEEKIQAASVKNLRGPYQVGELTAYVFRPLEDNKLPMLLASLEDTGLASGDAGSQEVDFNQLSPDELTDRAQRWYKTQMQRRAFGPYQKVAVVFDGSRTGAPELSTVETLIRTLDEMSRPGLMERAATAVRKAFGMPQP